MKFSLVLWSCKLHVPSSLTVCIKGDTEILRLRDELGKYCFGKVVLKAKQV